MAFCRGGLWTFLTHLHAGDAAVPGQTQREPGPGAEHREVTIRALRAGSQVTRSRPSAPDPST